MDYLLTFFEGIITFISPCLLPMLPVYLSFFAGQSFDHESQCIPAKKASTVINAIGFVFGFTVVFVLLGAFSGTIGSSFVKYKTTLNVVSGIIVILFGLNFLGILKIAILNTNLRFQFHKSRMPQILSSVLFGIIFSIGWTPCIGAFLGSALMLAVTSGQNVKGILLLLCFSAGLGIPFIISAVLIEQLKSTFEFIKRNYRIINAISGGLLLIVGLLMATGLMGYFLSLLTF
jgi:Cytochrome c biogenesis protein